LEKSFLRDKVQQPMFMQNNKLQTSKIDDGLSLCLAKNVICFDYVIQIQHYHPIFGKLHKAVLKRDAFFKGMTNHPMMLTVF